MNEFLSLVPVVYGKYWKTDSALHLGVSRRTIFNWISGKTSPDESVMELLRLYAKQNFIYDRNLKRVKKKNVRIIKY